MNSTHPKVDAYLGRAPKWRAEMERLRTLALETGLVEDMKWGKPCYTSNGANVFLIVAFKDWCSLLFTKGALIEDARNLLIQPTEQTQGARQMRFTSLEQVHELEAVIRDYLTQAIEAERSGAQVALTPIAERPLPEELQAKFEEVPDLKTAFEALTPGRRRHYLMHFSEPKQTKTRVARIEKCMEAIYGGKGLNDR